MELSLTWAIALFIMIALLMDFANKAGLEKGRAEVLEEFSKFRQKEIDFHKKQEAELMRIAEDFLAAYKKGSDG